MKPLIVLLALLSGCASYEVTCTPDGGKSVQIRSARAITGVAAEITPDCGISAVVGQGSGVGDEAGKVVEAAR